MVIRERIFGFLAGQNGSPDPGRLRYCKITGIAATLGSDGNLLGHEPSLGLFKHLNFEEWGNLPNVAILDGQERGLTILGKRLF